MAGIAWSRREIVLICIRTYVGGDGARWRCCTPDSQAIECSQMMSKGKLSTWRDMHMYAETSRNAQRPKHRECLTKLFLQHSLRPKQIHARSSRRDAFVAHHSTNTTSSQPIVFVPLPVRAIPTAFGQTKRNEYTQSQTGRLKWIPIPLLSVQGRTSTAIDCQACTHSYQHGVHTAPWWCECVRAHTFGISRTIECVRRSHGFGPALAHVQRMVARTLLHGLHNVPLDLP